MSVSLKQRISPMFVMGLLFILTLNQTFGQDLGIGVEDLRIEQRVDGGFHLFIRKKPDIGSVLITESTRDPSLAENNYAYRTPEWNPINGDEIRILDGAAIPRESGIRSLIDSTSETDTQFGEAFHIYIPYILNYGYEWGRHGEIYIVDGTYLNIRSFILPYGDYRANFQDNPFVIKVTQQPLAGPPEENYMKDTVESYTEIISGRGELVYSTGADDLVDKIGQILEAEKGGSLDLILCLDTTGSMKNDIDSVRRLLIPLLEDMIADFTDFRIGMVLYKDYYDEYLTRVVPFTKDFNVFRRNLNAIRTGGGRDIPEAIYEALHEAVIKFPWEAESKLIILIGDAPPHPRQRGKVSKAMVDEGMEKRNLKVHAIILPQ